MAWPGKFLLFFSSWFPAYAMMGALTFDSDRTVSYWYFAISVVGVLLYFVMEKAIFQQSASSLKIAEIERRDENVLMYIIAYLPPFFALDLTKRGQIVATAMFYLIFALTYVKLNLYYLNPMFVFRSFKTFTIKSAAGEEYIALINSPEPPERGSTVNYRKSDNILIITDIQSGDTDEPHAAA